MGREEVDERAARSWVWVVRSWVSRWEMRPRRVGVSVSTGLEAGMVEGGLGGGSCNGGVVIVRGEEGDALVWESRGQREGVASNGGFDTLLTTNAFR